MQLKRRHDLIPNLVETVKGVMKFEQDTLTKVIEARNKAIAAQGPADKAQQENVLSGALRQLFALVENYPNLKSNENVSKLQEELVSTENRIGFARQFYNDIATKFNIAQETFPTNMISGTLGFKPAELFGITEEGDKEAPPGWHPEGGQGHHRLAEDRREEGGSRHTGEGGASAEAGLR